MPNKESFFQKLLGSFISGKDADAAKKKQLKNIAKVLSKTHFKFYKSGSDQALPVMGKFFFDLYKALSNCQVLFASQQNPNYYKDVSINFVLTDNQKQLIEELSEEAIEPVLRAKCDDLGVKLGDFLMILRVAVTGTKISPPIVGSIKLLGEEETHNRIQIAIKFLKGEV